MAGPLICAPKWRDRAALHGVVCATPIGARRGAAPGADAAQPLLVAGTSIALTDDVRPGDLVVADELRTPDGAAATPAGLLLFGAVSRLGLRAHLGPVLSLPGSPPRWVMAPGDAVAATESAHLACGAAAGKTVTLHAVASTPASSRRGPGAAWRTMTALRALRAAAPAVDQWAAATGDREVLLASPRSFCAGVERAVQIVERALQRFGTPVYVRRQIVHNSHVVNRLHELGAVFVEELDAVPQGATVVLAAHGVSPTVRRDAEARQLNVIDATCPLVAKVHAEVRRFAHKGHTVFLIGHDDHEEVVGTRGESAEHVVVVADATQAADVQPRDPRKVAYVMQTTLAVDEAQRTAAVLRERFPDLVGPGDDDICYATSNRQAAVVEVARHSELVLVFGSSNSSNSRRLAEVAEKHGPPAYLVDDVSAVDLRWLAGIRRVGITAGASAPPQLVNQLVDALSGLGRISVREAAVVHEDVQFSLPRELG
jgi:4-hydroxy-3-methylbut-2-en-1-yl diphosphate reductase